MLQKLFNRLFEIAFVGVIEFLNDYGNGLFTLFHILAALIILSFLFFAILGTYHASTPYR